MGNKKKIQCLQYKTAHYLGIRANKSDTLARIYLCPTEAAEFSPEIIQKETITKKIYCQINKYAPFKGVHV
jgi:hypothetical protein